MKRLLSTSCSDWAFNIGTFVLRLGAGGLVIAHGYDKLVHFATLRHQFMSFMGIGSSTSLTLVIFAEFFCGLLVLLGLFTRLTVIPIVISMTVALVKAHHNDVFGAGEKAALFLCAFLAILLLGPGKASVDGVINK
ncbi:MAG TPA: DoxX family protein [Chitinophagaceae bacterium]|nr:DoxX family protein [Chitinophagaceae bacterium]